MTVSRAVLPVCGWMSMGMPRPLSLTVMWPSSAMVTLMRVANPAIASSTQLSAISTIRWRRPVGPVDPMYMLGRIRTASRSSSTWIWSALYSSLSGACWARRLVGLVGVAGASVAGGGASAGGVGAGRGGGSAITSEGRSAMATGAVSGAGSPSVAAVVTSFGCVSVSWGGGGSPKRLACMVWRSWM